MAERKAQDQNSENLSSFTTDADTTTMMPSITKLLNRKKLALSKGSENEATSTDAVPPGPPSAPPSAPSPVSAAPPTSVPSTPPQNLAPAPPVSPPPTAPAAPIPAAPSPPGGLAPASSLSETAAPASGGEGEISLSLDPPPGGEAALESSPSAPPSAPAVPPAGGIELSESAGANDGIELSFERPGDDEAPQSASAPPVVASPESPTNVAGLSLDPGPSPAAPGALVPPPAAAEPMGDTAPAAAATPRVPPTPVQRAGRRKGPTTVPKLQEWDRAMLATNADPVAKTLTFLFEHGGMGAVFMAPLPGSSAQNVEFYATAGVADPMKKLVWNGLTWKPLLVQELWLDLLKEGCLELSPPQLDTVATSHRNVVRGAFGLEAGEWLTLLRVGSAQACRGILVIVSRNSLAKAAPQALQMIGQ
jgi:hypothetical protein